MYILGIAAYLKMFTYSSKICMKVVIKSVEFYKKILLSIIFYKHLSNKWY